MTNLSSSALLKLKAPPVIASLTNEQEEKEQQEQKQEEESKRDGMGQSITSNASVTTATASTTNTNDIKATDTMTSTPGGTKKRPYRRTKRPANYCDKSTVTTVNEDGRAALEHLNAFDIVLQESRDLMQAAMEAQQLGRLKMASTYLLLLHARLVGLGKRFDKAVGGPEARHTHNHFHPNPNSTMATEEEDGEVEGVCNEHSDVFGRVEDTNEFCNSSDTSNPISKESQRQTKRPRTESNKNEEQHSLESPPRLQSTAGQRHGRDSFLSPPSTKGDSRDSNTASSATAITPKTAAAKQLASMLPNNIEMDQTMMEHLARAAAQLHAARSGKARRAQQHIHVDTTTPSRASLTKSNSEGRGGGDMWRPMDVHSNSKVENIQHSGTGNKVKRRSNNDSLFCPSSGSKNKSPSETAAATNNAVSFTSQEYQLLDRAVQAGQPDTKALAQQTGRSEVQIKAFLQNLNTKTRILEEHLDILQDLEGEEDNGKSIDDNNDKNKDDLGLESGCSQRAASGRGRKPATTAINTVPNAICDARVLLQGNILGYSNVNETSTSDHHGAGQNRDDDENKDEKEQQQQQQEQGDKTAEATIVESNRDK